MSNYLVKEFFERGLFRYWSYKLPEPYPWRFDNGGLSILVDIHKKNIFIPSIIFSVHLVKRENSWPGYAELCDNPKYKEILK